MTWTPPWVSRAMNLRAVPVGRSTVYHASNAIFSKFDPAKSIVGGYGPGLYFAENRKDVQHYGGWLYTAEIDIRNPLRVTTRAPGPEIITPLARAAKMTNEDLAMFTADGSHPLVSIMATLREDGVTSASLTKFFQKRGYDSIIVDPDVINHESPGSVTGNYVVVFDPKSILGMTRSANR